MLILQQNKRPNTIVQQYRLNCPLNTPFYLLHVACDCLGFIRILINIFRIWDNPYEKEV